MLFSIKPKLYDFQRALSYCDDYLYFLRGGAALNRYYCSDQKAVKQEWNGNSITFTTIRDAEIKFRANANSQGGKFWLQIEGKDIIYVFYVIYVCCNEVKPFE